jgi:hypothetical protein
MQGAAKKREEAAIDETRRTEKAVYYPLHPTPFATLYAKEQRRRRKSERNLAIFPLLGPLA